MKIEYIERSLSGSSFHKNHVLDSIYRRRGITSYEEIEYPLNKLLPPDFMGMNDAVNLLFDSIQKQDRVMVVADYDCDGATSCSVAVEGLRMLGFKDVRFIVPDRFKMGYGISQKVVDAIEPHEPDLIVTVDNGISAFEGCEAVRNLKHPTRLLITDHHIGNNEVPWANAIVNPNQVGCPFKSKALAGCGVIFYVLMAFKRLLVNKNWFIDQNINEPDLRELLDIVALGTVADVVPLDMNNRILVWHGINRINKGKTRPGIKALSDTCKVKIEELNSTDFGFALGPRINSAGRLDDMTEGINCLLAKDYNEAMKYAKIVDDLNVTRKNLTSEISSEVNLQLDMPQDVDKFGLCVFGENFNEGVIGIVASRLKEQYHRPVIVFTKDEEGFYKGSGRSVAEVHLRDVLINVDRETNHRILKKFGGHAMAAGMSIDPNFFEEFQEVFDKEVKKMLPSIKPVIETDGFLSPNDLNMETARLIDSSGPWGQHFPKPIFMGDFRISFRRVLKGKHLKFVLVPLNQNIDVQAICFNCLDNNDVLYPEGTVIRCVYEMSINTYNGKSSLQLMIRHFTALSETKI